MGDPIGKPAFCLYSVLLKLKKQWFVMRVHILIIMLVGNASLVLDLLR